MTPAELLATFPTPLDAYERTQRNFREGMLSDRCPSYLHNEFTSGTMPRGWIHCGPGGAFLTTYWAGRHTGDNVSTTLFRTPGGCR